MTLDDVHCAAIALTQPAAGESAIQHDKPTKTLAADVDSPHQRSLPQVMLVWLTPLLLARLIQKLAPRDKHEILLLHRTLEDWARSRFFGSAWAMVRGDDVLGAGGVMSLNEHVGVLWLAGTDQWTDYAMHVVRAWRGILCCRLYKRYEAQCRVDNLPARRFVEHFGFKPIFEAKGWIHYRMTP